MNVRSMIERYGVLPIIKTDDYKKAPQIASALKCAGLPVGEVVFRSPNAHLVVGELCSSFPEMAVGAGTILTNEQVDTAKAAGAQYIVSPGIDAELVDYSLESGLLPVPGCATASEVQLAVKKGLSILKFFPARQMGGLSTINALAAPFPAVKYIPTNGVGFDNIEEYMANPNIAACGGIFPCPEELILQEDWDGITRLCVKALELVQKVREQASSCPKT